MSSLRAEGTSEMTIAADGKPMGKPQTRALLLMFKRPDRIVLDSGAGRMTADGKSVYNYLAAAKQYAKAPMNQGMLKGIASTKPDVAIFGLLFGNDYRKSIVSPKMLPDAKLGTHDVYVISFGLKPGPGAPKGVGGRQTLWIGKTDMGIYRNKLSLALDTRLLSRVAPKGPNGKVAKVIETTTTNDLTTFEPNIKLTDSVFQFKPPSGAKPVKQPNLMGMINKPAPDFTFKAADSTSKKLSELRGKFVLLSFWGLPMSEQQLPVLQSLSKALSPDTELVTICLNSDKAAVVEYLMKKGDTFPVVFADADIGRIAGEQYGIRVLPTTLIVDKKGVVRAQFVGLISQKQIEDRVSGLR